MTAPFTPEELADLEAKARAADIGESDTILRLIAAVRWLTARAVAAEKALAEPDLHG